MSIKIKQLEWEDCTPTISSSVVSRAQVLGYTFEVYLSDFYEKSAEDQPGYAISVNGKPLTWGHTSPRAWMTKGFAQLALQELFEARIAEVVEEEQPAITLDINLEWSRLKTQLGDTSKWTAAEFSTYLAFFAHGWYARNSEAAFQKKEPSATTNP